MQYNRIFKPSNTVILIVNFLSISLSIAVSILISCLCPNQYCFHFKKVDPVTKEGIENVTFELIQNEMVVAKAISSQDGNVAFFNISPGQYQLKEFNNFDKKTLNFYTILIQKNGTILIDNTPISEFQI